MFDKYHVSGYYQQAIGECLNAIIYLLTVMQSFTGMLHIQTKFNPTLGRSSLGGTKVFNYTSGWIDTKNHFSQMYGRFSANCSLPPHAATGIWPAFWLLPQSDQCWPTGGEIDVFEFLGGSFPDATWGSYHWGKKCGLDLEVYIFQIFIS